MLFTADSETLCRAFLSGANKLCNNKLILNDLNVFPVPDGDTGSNMSMTVSAAAKEILKNDFDSVGKVMNAIASASLRGARGNSGVILSQLFRGMSRRLSDLTSADAIDIAECLKEGVNAAYKAVMKPMEGTVLSVSRDSADAALKALDSTGDIVEIIRVATKAAQESLARTPELLPQLKQAGVVDSGAQGVVYILEGALSYLETGEMVELTDAEISVNTTFDKKAVDANIKFVYCTEFLINSPERRNIALLRKALSGIGNSAAVAEHSGIIKVHVHTNNPDKALSTGLELGELTDIKIDNMRIQSE